LANGVAFVAASDQIRVSDVYETEPIGGVAQDNFWNLVVELVTNDPARALLDRAHGAEAAAHRTREVRWGPRTLDVDVLLVGDERTDDSDFVVPHPRMWQRRFVLAPLRELAPALVDAAHYEAATGEVVRLGTLSSLR
jgi:2-amino-4-hydroxy-6-hydroxymethyldihydropteridine diphosphokinase